MVTSGEETAAPHRVRSDHSPALDDAISTAHTYLVVVMVHIHNQSGALKLMHTPGMQIICYFIRYHSALRKEGAQTKHDHHLPQHARALAVLCRHLVVGNLA